MMTNHVIFVSETYGKWQFWVNRLQERQGLAAFVALIDEVGNVEAPGLEEASIVVEWTSGESDLKQGALQSIERQVTAETLILSTAHLQMISETALYLQHPERLVGFSPFGGYNLHPSVTLTQAPQTTPAYREKAENFFYGMGLTVHWIQDTPGMVLPRIYAMLANEAAFAVQDGVATPEAIDTAMRLGTHYPIGPLAWADFVGINAVLQILEGLHQRYQDPRYRPCLLLQKMVMAGQLGKASGQGFYHYTAGNEVTEAKDTPQIISPQVSGP